MTVNFDEWWIEFRGFDDSNGKEGARLAFEAGVAWELTKSLFPQPVYREREGEPCGECHLLEGERCDICGVVK